MSTSLLDVAEALYNRINAVKRTYNIQDVFFGDQSLIPRTPAICVQPVSVEVDPTDTGFQSIDKVGVWVFVYHGKIQAMEANFRECLEYAETIRTLINSDKKNSTTVLLGFVERMELGAASKNNGELMLSTRFTWTAINKATF